MKSRSLFLSGVALRSWFTAVNPAFASSRRLAALCLALLGATAISGRAANITWTNASGGNWNTAANWSPNQVPGASDSALITNNGTYTVTVDGSVTVMSLLMGGTSGTQTISIPSSTLTLNGASTININAVLALSGGTLTGTGDVTVTGALAWSGGTMDGSGTTVVPAGVSWSLSGSAGKILGRTLNNGGTATWTGGTIIFVNPSGNFNNQVGAVFNVATANDFVHSGGSGSSFNNAGTFNKTNGGAMTLTDRVAFNNTGLMNLAAGSFSFAPGSNPSSNSKDIVVAAGAILNLNSMNHLAGSTLSGAGNVNFNGGTSTFDSGSSYQISGTTSINGGRTDFNIGVALVVLNLSSGTLGGSGTVTVSNFTWSGGTMDGSGTTVVPAGVSWSLSGSAGKTLGRTLNNGGTATWTGGTITFVNPFNFNNQVGAVFNVATANDFVHSGGSGSFFNNAGTFNKTNGGTMTLSDRVGFNNTGLMNLTAGSLTCDPFSNPSSNSKDIVVSAGATLNLGSFSNSGFVDLQGGTMNVSLYVQTAGLTLLNGGNLAVSQPFQLQGGTLAGTNTVTGSVNNSGLVSPGVSPGQLTITGNYTQTASGAMNIELAGTSPGTSFDRLAVGGTATLAGTLNVTLTNGFYPATNAMFTFLTCASRSGTFATFNYPSNDVGMQVSYTPTNATIQVINVRPVIPAITDQIIDEGVLFSLMVNATDADTPQQTLTYTLTNSPVGATVTSSGEINWTPLEAQGPAITNITVRVKDNGTPNLTVSRTFQVTVREINVAPMLTLPSNPSVNEQTTFNANATATDSDVPTNALTFALVSGPPGLTVSSTGAIEWMPGEADGSNSYTVKIRVTDTNQFAVNEKQLSTTNMFTLIVNEVNLPPMLGVLADYTVNAGQTISFTATATDPDLPTNTLAFSLITPPAGATIASGSGLFHWRVKAVQADTTNVVQVRVMDDGIPNRTDTKSFTVIINPIAPVMLTPVSYSGGQFTMSVTGPIGPDYIIQGSTNLIDWTNLQTNTPTSVPFNYTDTNAGALAHRFYRALLDP